MNQENSSVLELLRQAAVAAAAAVGSGLDRPGGLSHWSGLAGRAAEKPAWTGWVARVNPIAGLIAGLFAGKRDTAAAAPVATYRGRKAA